ncbi:MULTISPECIES: hypothetical protein [Streptomyces]|uniref:Uncharacterized protein n=1 Tax=Streptomyces tendae TaxID=1932 RepID=A0A6B3QBN2_STRTE|nr:MULTISPECIES: hypothetical protein [Streptomyces]MBQ0964031.1 hypothetical protein [Streptomyces sp. RK74B]MBQ1004017.1 hypothetical protein [Streptomyces sp. RK23]NEV85763.1 hypothetical protein [Streptomyces tendae]
MVSTPGGRWVRRPFGIGQPEACTSRSAVPRDAAFTGRRPTAAKLDGKPPAPTTTAAVMTGHLP